jgi:hypothetical protein
LALLNKEQKKENKKGILRWPMFALGIILFFTAFLREEITSAIFIFTISAIIGFIIDCLGVAKLKLWRYTKQEFLKPSYFCIVVPAWGVFGMAINFFWNLIHLPEIIVFIVITTGLFSFCEVPNFKTKSWEYYVPIWIVMFGWFPLIFIFRILFLLIF